ncbi:hypothetical protein NMY22_g9953 [Coprinellus aureogranulatus]|nr:hypothetical protein NMY22_g9953 [Coprinellus aureogranulatus]
MDTTQVASSSGLRQLRERKKRKYEVDDSSDDDEPMMQHRRAGKRRSSGTPTIQRNKRSGKLACFVNMPLDVLHEVRPTALPINALTRTTREFRRILLHKSSVSTWRASFDDVPTLPECPPEMSEPAWANLAFSPQCHFCNATGPLPVAFHSLQVQGLRTYNLIRLIEVDSNGTLSDLYRDIPGGLGPLPGMVDGLQDMFTLLPNRLGKRYKRVFLRKQLVEFRNAAQKLATPEEKSAFLKERYDVTQELNMHAANCEAWAHNQADDRSEELTRLRKERQSAIVKKFEELGYKDDIHWRGACLSRENFANKPQRLTERIWKNIKPEALKWIENVRQQRQRENHRQLVLTRKGIASKYLRNYKNARLPCTDIYPEPPDFCEFDAVKRICHQPVDVVVDLSTFDSLNSAMPELLKTWREKVHAGIRDVLLKSMTAAAS